MSIFSSNSRLNAKIFAIKNLRTRVGDGLIDDYLNNLDELIYILKITEEEIQQAQNKLELYQKQNINIVNRFDQRYPQNLLELESPPAILYFYGSFEQLAKIKETNSVSIVGTRVASLYGKHSTRAIVQSLENFQCNIISGLARGIDSEAHLTAIESGLSTVAVIGSGLLNFHYGGGQRKLFNQMIQSENHLVISEFSPEFPAQAWTFVHRNRIIAALSKACFVIEAHLQSGSLTTARFAYELDKDIFTLPGDLSKDSFKGSNQLIETKRAQAIHSISSVSKFLDLDEKQKKAWKNPIVANKDAQKVMANIDIEPVSFDFLVNQLNINQISLMKLLTNLEIQGHIRREAGALYAKRF